MPIKKSKDFIKNPNLKSNLISIKSNFEIIPCTIKLLELKGIRSNNQN